jgi:chorismate mutase
MAKKPDPGTPSLTDLRREIDRIDESMHGLLMERGDIIDRLISVKQTQETGSAFRPAREADMMRRLVERHKGILPLDTAESIWRVIISTFTFVQAPFAVHADLSAGDAHIRDSARFHFGFTVPFVAHMGAANVVEAVSESKGDLGLVPAFAVAGGGAWWSALEFDSAPKIIARLPFVAPTTRRRCRCSWSRARRQTPWCAKYRCGASASPAGAPRRRTASPRSRRRLRCRTTRSTVPRSWFRSPMAGSSVPSAMPSLRPEQPSAPRLSSGATRPAIGSPRKRPEGSR